MPSSLRSCLATVTGVLLLSSPACALDSPLSEQAIREAYFLGQRHDGTYPRLLGKYMKFLPRPKSGPHISSVAFSTPFLQMVAYADGYVGNYSAQQAQIDYRNKGHEVIKISVEIQLTESYALLIPVSANSASKSSPALVSRPHDFWKDFEVRIYDGDQKVVPADSRGHANSNCGRRGPCVLIGATLEFDFPATAFTADSVTIDVMPPEGDPVSVDFDLSSLR
jgi:hypothetical protein